VRVGQSGSALTFHIQKGFNIMATFYETIAAQIECAIEQNNEKTVDNLVKRFTNWLHEYRVPMTKEMEELWERIDQYNYEWQMNALSEEDIAQIEKEYVEGYNQPALDAYESYRRVEDAHKNIAKDIFCIYCGECIGDTFSACVYCPRCHEITDWANSIMLAN
jgi:hypothetical protein